MLEQAHWMRPMCAHVPSFNKDSSENFPEHLTFPSTKKQGTTKERFWIICWICPGSDAQIRKQSLQHPCWCFQGLQWVHWTRSLLAFQHPQIMHSKHLLARSERRRVISLVSLSLCVFSNISTHKGRHWADIWSALFSSALVTSVAKPWYSCQNISCSDSMLASTSSDRVREIKSGCFTPNSCAATSILSRIK